MTAQTSEALLALLEADPNYIPLRSRERYDITAKPSERAESINAQSPQLLLSIHGNSAPEGSAASGFECYPSVPGRTWHQESYYFRWIRRSHRPDVLSSPNYRAYSKGESFPEK